jgi:hypothetical protein
MATPKNTQKKLPLRTKIIYGLGLITGGPMLLLFICLWIGDRFAPNPDAEWASKCRQQEISMNKASWLEADNRCPETRVVLPDGTWKKF